VGENFGKLQAKLYLAKKTLVNLSPVSVAFSDITSNWQINFGEFVANRQIHQSFLPPTFSTIRYSVDNYTAEIVLTFNLRGLILKTSCNQQVPVCI